MCGLIGAFNSKNKKDVNRWVTYQLQDQLSRGQDGLGAIFIDEHKNIKIERATEITKTLIDLHFINSRMMILHHRNPTSSENKIQETHPIYVSNKKLKYDYYVIHNGIMRNEYILKEKHFKLGFIYTTLRRTTATIWSTVLGAYINKLEFNDSESFAIEIARFIDLGLKKIEVAGTWAFITLQVNKKTKKATKVFYGNDGFNPLNVSAKKGQIRLSSEGEGEPIKEFQLYHFNLNDLKIHKNRHIYIHELEIKKQEEDEFKITKTNNKDLTKRTTNLNPNTQKSEYPYIAEPVDTTEEDEDPDMILDEADEEIVKHVEAFWDIIKDESVLYTLDIKKEIKETLSMVSNLMKEAYKNYRKAMIDLAIKTDYSEQIANNKERTKRELNFIKKKK